MWLGFFVLLTLICLGFVVLILDEVVRFDIWFLLICLDDVVDFLVVGCIV